MRVALVAFVILLAGLTPGLLKHGQPYSYGGQSVAASSASDKPAHPLLAFLQRWKPA